MHYSRLVKVSLVVAFPILFSACARVPHNDVLIFGTNTKVALDVSSDVANANAPSVTLGYKRQEIAWIPLRANGIEIDAKGNKKVVEKGSKYQSADDKKKDAYSTFGSFGGTFGAGSETKGAISQFFATGMAAQNISSQPFAAASMVSIQTTDAKNLSQQQEISELHKALGEEKVKNISLKAIKERKDKEAKVSIIMSKLAKANGDVDDVLFTKIMDKSKADGKIKTPWTIILPQIKKADKLKDALIDDVDDMDVIDSFYEQLK